MRNWISQVNTWAALVCVLIMASSFETPRAQTVPAATMRPASAPIAPSGLAGTDWVLKVRRTDNADFASDDARNEQMALQFLPNGRVLVRQNYAIYMPAYIVKGNNIAILGDGMRISLAFANGPTTGAGSLNLASFNVTGLEHRGAVDLSTPFYQSILQNDTCAFATRALQTTLDGFFNLPANAVYYQLDGSASSNRYDTVLASAMKGKSKSFKGVKSEYERRVAALSDCVVVVHERPYGLEVLNELDPADQETFNVDSVFRLRNAPDYLQHLRIHVNGNWLGSPWVSVGAGLSASLGDGPDGKMINAQERLKRHRNLQWTPVSTAPATADPLAFMSVKALMNAGNALNAQRSDPRENRVNWGAQAIRYYHAACERGEAVACGRKAEIMSNGVIGVGLKHLARPLLEKGCSANDQDSCYELAMALSSSMDRIGAKALLEPLCAEAYGKACGSLGLMAENASPKDLPRAAAMYDRGCALQDEYSCLNGGKLYYFGANGVAKDWPRARNMLTSACGTTNWLVADSCAIAAKMYIDGEGGQASSEIAMLMLKRGCDMRSDTSCKVLKLPVPR